MKVKELIKALVSCPQDADIITEGFDDWGDCDHLDVRKDKKSVYLMRSEEKTDEKS